MDSHLPAGFVSVDQKSDLQIAVENLTRYILLEKQKSWKEGFQAATDIHNQEK